MPHRQIARAAVSNIITAASHAASITVQPDIKLSETFNGDPPAGSPHNWIAYRCFNVATQQTDELIRLSYGIWLAWGGHTGLRSTLKRQIELEATKDGRTEPKDMPSILGHLIFPDLIEGQLPGTFWLPDPKRLDAPAWPKMPDARIITAQKRRRALDNPA